MENIFDIILVPLGYIISFCYKLIPNYAIALLLFAIIIKVITFYFGIKQQKNMVKQASLRPKEMAIRKRYAGRTDKATQQKLNEEIMNLYQKENFNPMGGCLPMLIQLPVLLAVYQVVINPLRYICGFTTDTVTAIGKKINELYVSGVISTEGISQTIVDKLDKVKAAVEGGKAVADVGVSLTGIENVSVLRNIDFSHFAGIIPEGFTAASLPDFTIFGGKLDLGMVPSFSPINILIIIPILTFIAVYFGMKLNKKFMYQPQAQTATGDKAASNKIMDLMMPLISVWISFSVPAVVGVYWIYQQILGTVQQFVLAKMYPYPTFTEEEMREAEKQMNGSVRKKKKVRSLHRIDEEDEEETAPEANEAPAPKAMAQSSQKSKKKESQMGGLIEKAPLKDEKTEEKPETEDKDGE